MDYHQLRELADSWGLVFMALVMILVCGWTFRPGSKHVQRDASLIPLRDDEVEP